MLRTVAKETNLIWQRQAIIEHTQRLLQSYRHWTGKSLVEETGTPTEQTQTLFRAPFVVVSHGTEIDPVLNYGNQQALILWDYDWDTFTRLPSRLTAAPEEQQGRSQLLSQARNQGLTQGSQGVRISRTGRRFWIKGMTLWTVLEGQISWGQAATFSQWQWL